MAEAKQNEVDLSATAVLKKGNTAVITGASSGIGRAASIYCASKGMNVWMLDIVEDELKSAKALVLSKAADKEQKIETRICDVASAEKVEAIATEVFADGGKCHFLMNNAGIGQGGDSMTSMEMVLKVMGVNTYGPIHGCLSFIPKMKEMNEPGIIVNTGSKQGITMPPGNLTYNMSKAALKAYTEGLEFELDKLRREENGKLKAALLVPGWTNTSIVVKSMKAKAVAQGKGDEFDPKSAFFSEEKPNKGAWMPMQVVEYMVGHLNDDKFYIICPDNECSEKLDKVRMEWTMQDIIQNRPPLSRWHPDYKEAWKQHLSKNDL